MKPVRVKVCGITRAEDATRAAELGATAVGFVLWEPSPRAVSVLAAARLAAAVPAGVSRIGVFVDATPAEVSRAVREVGLDAVQLHGDEPVGEFFGVAARLLKAVTLETREDVDAAAGLPAEVTVLVDATDRVRRGGTGRRADWSLAAALSARREVWLAGGLTVENVAEAIRHVRPAAVDVSSGVESSPGVKDATRLAAFLAATRLEPSEDK